MRPASAPIRKAVHIAIRALADYGADVKNYSVPPRVRFSNVGWTAYVDNAARRDMHEAFGIDAFDELRNQRQGTPTVAYPAFEFYLGSSKLSLIMEKLFDGAYWRQSLQNMMRELVGDGGVIVCPIFPTTAPKHGWQGRWLAALSTVPYQAWVNLAGLPALTIPIDKDKKGLPTAVQIVGSEGREDMILAAGLAIEQWVSNTPNN